MENIKTILGIILFGALLGLFLSEVDQGVELFLVVAVLLIILVLWIGIRPKQRLSETPRASRQDREQRNGSSHS